MAEDKGLFTGLVAQVITVSALLSGAGFLAVRAHLQSLGLPPHASLDAQGYLEYGGRFFFGLLGHLLLVLAALFVFLLAGSASVRWMPSLGRWMRHPATIAVGINALSIAAIYNEFLTLNTPALFRFGQAIEPGRSVWPLVTAEVLVTASILWSIETRKELATLVHDRLARRQLAVLTAAVALVSALLLPVAFGRTSMFPRSLNQVTLLTEKGEVKGLLVFSDAGAHFIWSGTKKLLEIPRDTVKEISYEGPLDLASPSR